MSPLSNNPSRSQLGAFMRSPLGVLWRTRVPTGLIICYCNESTSVYDHNLPGEPDYLNYGDLSGGYATGEQNFAAAIAAYVASNKNQLGIGLTATYNTSLIWNQFGGSIPSDIYTERWNHLEWDGEYWNPLYPTLSQFQNNYNAIKARNGMGVPKKVYLIIDGTASMRVGGLTCILAGSGGYDSPVFLDFVSWLTGVEGVGSVYHEWNSIRYNQTASSNFPGSFWNEEWLDAIAGAVNDYAP